MKQAFLGDSYDILKRFWADSLRPIAPLYAHARFIPLPLRAKYSLMTGISILDPAVELPGADFGILLDPNTGVPLPRESASPNATISHTPLRYIARAMEECAPAYLICFDQSFHRIEGLDKRSQRGKKLDYLRELGYSGFYYVSHAPFLFVFPNPESLSIVLAQLERTGLPKSRLELSDPQLVTT
ncbi:MAG TPA: hypothetical protein VMD55_11965 [Terracidiphilus sp.]|nr:hypothetical protein [Terracidiphilus sp.]